MISQITRTITGTRISAAIAAIALTLPLAGCTSDTSSIEPTADAAASEAAIGKLEYAKTIKLDKAGFSLGDKWSVKADGEDVATIEGKTLYMIGDVYELSDMGGNLLGYEAEQARAFTHGADLYDAEKHNAGEIETELFSWGYHFQLKDEHGTEVGGAKQKLLAWTLNMDLTGRDEDDVEWKMEKAAFSWGDSITLTKVKDGDTDLSAVNAIWLSVIANEIDSSSSSSSSSQRGSRK